MKCWWGRYHNYTSKIMQQFTTLRAAALTGLAMGLASPSPAFAAGKDIKWVIDSIIMPILRSVIVLLFALALLWFIWSVMNYIGGAGTKKPEAAANVGWSILALFVMISVWGLVKLLQNTVPLDNTQPTLPNFSF